MTLTLDRRSLIIGGSFGLGAFALPAGRALAAGLIAARGFTHAVASGEPGPDSILLWTRFVPATGEMVRLDAEIALDRDFARIVGRGAAQTGAWRDWTAKLTLDRLSPGTRYFYRFRGPDGSISAIGETRTLPEGPVARFGIGAFSCANVPFGFFNAYAHAASRPDLDLCFHVGDYLYEYPRGTYPSDAQSIPARVLEPAHEITSLADYRLRYACYRADPDLQALHRLKPMIALWDDHESANDSWEGGAQNHQPAEGMWSDRRAAAIQAWREWMPVSDEPWKAYPIGRLATLYRTESRLLARTRPPEFGPLFAAAEPAAALKAFRDGPWLDASATMLGSAQESWLAHRMKANRGWQIVGTGANVGSIVMPAAAKDWLKRDASAFARGYVERGILAGSLGLPANLDNWGGYPAARARLLRSAQAADADLVLLTGDSHNGFAFALAHEGKPAGVEFGGHSVTSSGMEADSGADPKRVAAALVAANSELKWADTSHRGYMAIEITPARVTGEWVFMAGVAQRSTALAGTHRMRAERGRRVFSAA